MNGKFFELKKEKQDRMINAALKVFAINGYRHASTDDVVKEAGISKGLLFHYFENKLGVYQFAYDYSVRYMSLELSTFVGSREKDLFEMVKQIQSARLDAMKGYPYMQQFLARSTYEDANEVLMIIGQKKRNPGKCLPGYLSAYSFQCAAARYGWKTAVPVDESRGRRIDSGAFPRGLLPGGHGFVRDYAVY
jgi:AcrR family transcriptional regulator